MGDGAGVKVFIYGSGDSQVSVTNGRMSVDVQSGVAVTGTVQPTGMSGITFPQTASGTLRVSIVGSGEADLVYVTGASDSNGVNRVMTPVSNYNYVYDRASNTWRRLDTAQSGRSAIQVATSGYETVTTTLPNIVRTRDVLLASNNSGGDLLQSGDCRTVTIRFLTKGSGGVAQSGEVYVGFDASPERPFSGHGFVLTPGDGITLNVTGMHMIRIFATNSGERVSYIANQI